METKWFVRDASKVLREAIKNGKFPFKDEDKIKGIVKEIDSDCVFAVLEYPAVDIELNILAENEECGLCDIDSIVDYTKKNPEEGEFWAPHVEYVVCKKISEDDWETYDYPEDLPNVDWLADNWMDLLHADMDTALKKMVSDRKDDLSLSEIV